MTVGLLGSGAAAYNHLISLQDEGTARLAQARELYQQGEYLQALELVERTRVLYANLFGSLRIGRRFPNLGQEARNLIEELKSDPAVTEALAEREALKRYSKIVRLEAKIARDPTKYYDLYKTLKTIAKRFPGCPTGRNCSARVEQLQADERIMKQIKQEKDRRSIRVALQKIDEAERRGEPDQAQAERQRLLRQFPGKTIGELQEQAGRHT